jgi:acyl-CoA thioesterase I
MPGTWVIGLLLSVAALSAQAAPLRVVILGDSLTDGYGIARESAYPALIDRRLKSEGHGDIEVVNAGISGSTTASAKGRLKWHLKNKPGVLVIALGANDGLRGMKIDQTRRNLSKLIATAKSEGIQVMLAGMRLPPNYGKEYTEGFAKLYRDLAREHAVPLVPFLLEGVGGEKELNLEDGMHPNERGHEKMAQTLYPHLLKLIQKGK